MTTRWADTYDVEAYAADHRPAIVQCRVYGHGWKPSSVTRAGLGFVVMQRCSRCGNRRTHDMDSRGYAQSWRYLYTEGYLTEDMGRIDVDGRAVLRLSAVSHLPINDPEGDDNA